MSGGRETYDQKLGAGVPETRHRAPPISPLQIGAALHASHHFSISHQARTSVAGNDGVVQNRKLLFRILRHSAGNIPYFTSVERTAGTGKLIRALRKARLEKRGDVNKRKRGRPLRLPPLGHSSVRLSLRAILNGTFNACRFFPNRRSEAYSCYAHWFQDRNCREVLGHRSRTTSGFCCGLYLNFRRGLCLGTLSYPLCFDRLDHPRCCRCPVAACPSD